jgi:hypothetical protein
VPAGRVSLDATTNARTKIIVPGTPIGNVVREIGDHVCPECRDGR